jgi:serine phosphatase RsbU (regulator of sigma subunit)/Tfp pilus assembly protein PilF
MANCLSELGSVYQMQGNYPKALEFFIKSLTLRKVLKQERQLPGAYNNIGVVYGLQNEWDKALEYFNKSLELNLKYNITMEIGSDYNNIGIAYIINKNFESAKVYLKEGLKYRLINKDTMGIGGSYNNLSLLELQFKNRKKALELADSALFFAQRSDSKKLLSEVYLSYYEIYSAFGDYKNALENFKKQKDLESAYNSENNKLKIEELQKNIELEGKEKEILEKDLQIEKAGKLERQKNLIIKLSSLGVLVLLIVVIFVLITNNKIKTSSIIIKDQKALLEEKHKDITDSINYAQKIQTALIVSEKTLSSKVDNVFVMFKPRDIVSGDFYWFGQKNGYKLLAVADCTGHGVPGAFMSMIGITLLNQIVNEKGIVSPAEILNKLREGVVSSLNQTADDEKRDGMDVSLIAWNKDELIYAGANNPCIVISNNEIMELKPDKQPVGLYEKQQPFTEQKIELKKVDSIYLFTDGIVDQFGGPENKKVKVKLFRDWLSEIGTLDSVKQKTELEKKFNEWKGKAEQTDDILVIGIKA